MNSERKVQVAIAHDSGLSGAWVTQHLPRDNGIEVGDVIDSLSVSSDAMRTSDADVLLVACSRESSDALELVGWWVGHHPGHPVLVLCQNSANGFVRSAFAAGADDLVVLDPGPDVSPEAARNLGFALHKALVRRLTGDDAVALATVICVLGPKGGVGKTTVSCNVATSLAVEGRRTALVDLDLQFGDVALFLGLSPERTIYDLATSGGSLDAEKVDAYLLTHRTGLRVLAAPVRLDQAGLVTPEFALDVIATLRTRFDYVVIDTPPTFVPSVIAAVDASSYVCMVGTLDAPSLKNTRLGLETLELMNYPSDRIRIVLNRGNANVGINHDDVLNVLGREPDVLVPSSRDITRSVNEGEPIVLSDKRSEGARAFGALTTMLSHAASPAAPSKRRGGLFARSRA